MDTFKKNTKITLLGMGMMIALTGCGIKLNTDAETNTHIESNEQESTTKKKNTKEGILVIGDEIFLIEYSECSNSGYYDDQITIILTDGTKLITTLDNFYEYDKNSETMNKVKQLTIEEDHIIK